MANEQRWIEPTGDASGQAAGTATGGGTAPPVLDLALLSLGGLRDQVAGLPSPAAQAVRVRPLTGREWFLAGTLVGAILGSAYAHGILDAGRWTSIVVPFPENRSHVIT